MTKFQFKANMIFDVNTDGIMSSGGNLKEVRQKALDTFIELIKQQKEEGFKLEIYSPNDYDPKFYIHQDLERAFTSINAKISTLNSQGTITDKTEKNLNSEIDHIRKLLDQLIKSYNNLE